MICLTRPHCDSFVFAPARVGEAHGVDAFGDGSIGALGEGGRCLLLASAHAVWSLDISNVLLRTLDFASPAIVGYGVGGAFEGLRSSIFEDEY